MLPAFRKRKFPNPGHTQATPFQSESLFPQRVACSGWHPRQATPRQHLCREFFFEGASDPSSSIF